MGGGARKGKSVMSEAAEANEDGLLPLRPPVPARRTLRFFLDVEELPSRHSRVSMMRTISLI